MPESEGVSADARLRRLRVLVDASGVKEQQGGIRSYTLGLVDILSRQNSLDVTVATPRPEDFSWAAVSIYPIKTDVRSPLRRLVWRETRLPALMRSTCPDVVVVPTHEHPIRPISVPTVMVMHDLGPLVAPVHYGRKRWLLYLLGLPWALRSSSAVVNMSHATYADLMGNFHVETEKCYVIETGVQQLPETNGARVVEDDYALYVGALWRHKNVDTLIRAYASDDGRLPAKLVLAGPHLEEEQERVRSWAKDYGMPSERLIQLGYVPSDKLSALYRDASVFVLPSLHEGFGAPIIEAMRLRIPVVASDIPAHREVAREAARYVSEMFGPSAWRDAIGEVYTNAATREALSIRGLERAGYYTWDRIGMEWISLIRGLASERGD